MSGVFVFSATSFLLAATDASRKPLTEPVRNIPFFESTICHASFTIADIPDLAAGHAREVRQKKIIAADADERRNCCKKILESGLYRRSIPAANKSSPTYRIELEKRCCLEAYKAYK